MRVFDRIDSGDLDRRELQLWFLAITMILVLVIGLALLMYPAIFSNPVVLAGPTLRKLFFGFCALSLLSTGYLLDRQLEIHQLRRSLAEEQKLIVRVQHEASSDLLGTLPGLDHFRDHLAMEHRRAAITQQPLTVLVAHLKASHHLIDQSEIVSAFGDGAKALSRKLRVGDTIYQIDFGAFAVMLPGVTSDGARYLAKRLAEGLYDAAGASSRFVFDLRMFNYPEHVASARELDEAVRGLLPAGVAVSGWDPSENVPASTL